MKISEILSVLKPLKKIASYMERRKQEGVARPLSNSYGNVITAFPSKKNRVVVRGESFIEVFLLMALELCFFVKEFLEQPPTEMIKRPNKRGYEYNRPYTPDAVVKLENGTQIAIEAKPSAVIEKDLLLEHPRFAKVGDRYEDTRAKEHFLTLGVHHIVITELDFGKDFYSNACLIGGYVNSDCPSQSICAEIDEILKAKGVSTLERLALEIETQRDAQDEPVENLDREKMLECVNWMLVNGQLYGNLDGCSIQDISGFEVYSLRSIARSCIRDREDSTVTEAKGVELDLAEGAIVHFEGRTYTVFSANATKVYLRDEDDRLKPFTTADIEKFFQDGELTCSERDKNELTPFAAADTIRQQSAILRSESIATHEAGLKLMPDRTYHDLKRREKAARLVYGCGLSGLLPSVRLGNRTPKTCETAKSYLIEYIRVSYLGFKPNPDSSWSFAASTARETDCKQDAWADYRNMAQKEELTILSYSSFLRALKKISLRSRVLSKKGRKAAYQVANPFSGKWSGATHGQFAGHIVEIDHTLIDLEVVDENDGNGLGRLWLTVAIDTYSRMILAYHISFSPPSRVSLMMVMRDVVRRNGYLPLCLSVDGGKEFHSLYFDKLLAQFRLQKRSRPPARPRCGSIIERLFGTINQDFWHNLIGNTVLMVNPRQVSKEFIAKNRAIWGVKELEDAFEKYIVRYNTVLVHSSIGCTPVVRHNASYSNLLPMQKRQIRYDESYRMQTLLAPESGLMLMNRRGCLEVNGGRYTNGTLKIEALRGRKFQVKWDANDMRHVYYAHNGEWQQAWLVGGPFDALSEYEVKILSDIERAKWRGKYKVNLTRVFTKASANALLKTDEEELKLRRAQLDRERASELEDDYVNYPVEFEDREVDFTELPAEPITTDLFSD